jgi:hypothetical protein
MKEEALLGLLPIDGPGLNTNQIVAQIYPDPPLNARVIVICRLKGINDKAIYHREPWRVMKSKRNGPNAIIFWRARI